jgi:hypothetical protein
VSTKAKDGGSSGVIKLKEEKSSSAWYPSNININATAHAYALVCLSLTIQRASA